MFSMVTLNWGTDNAGPFPHWHSTGTCWGPLEIEVLNKVNMRLQGWGSLHGRCSQWVVCSTPRALSPDALSPDVLSPHALSPNGLRNTWKNQALQMDFFRESIQNSISDIIYITRRLDILHNFLL